MSQVFENTEAPLGETLPRTCLVDAPWYSGDVVAGRYRLETLIGEGGMGLVFRSHHLVLDQPIALKLVRSTVARNASVVARFLDEARAIARLKSPHVVHVFDSGTADDGTPYMALELLNGWDLHSVLEHDGPLPFDLAARYVIQACHAIAEAHSFGIIHRDLKPENLFLHHGEDGVELIKVLDFGVSKRLRRDDGRSHTIQGETVGSPHYMAPEQMAARDVDERSDVWSLGVVLFELVTARFPFEGESFAELYGALLAGDAEPLSCFHSAVPPGFEAIVARCLRKNPAERYASAVELAEALSAFSRKSAPCAFETEKALEPGEPFEAWNSSDRPTMISVAPRAEAETSLQIALRPQEPRNLGWIFLSLMAALAAATAGASALGFPPRFSAQEPGSAPINEEAASSPAAPARDPFFAPVQVEGSALATVALAPVVSATDAPVIEERHSTPSLPRKPIFAGNAKNKPTWNNPSNAVTPRSASSRAVDELIAPYEGLPERRAQAYDSKR